MSKLFDNMSPNTAGKVLLGSIFMLLISKCCTADDAAAAAPYAGCSIIGFPQVSTDAQAEELFAMEGLDYFIGPSTSSISHVMVCGDDKDKLKQRLASYKIKPVVLVEDMSQSARSRDHFADLPLGQLDWNDYHGLENIYAWLDQVVKKYPKLISMQVIGKSYEQRDLRVYTIQKEGAPSSLKATYFECLIHPREWTISGVCTYIINELTSKSSQYSKLLDAMRFYILPITNPDGFVYTNGTGHDLWRKNRRIIKGVENITCDPRQREEAVGADLNRNWPYQWKFNPRPCEHNYPGERVGTDDTKNVVEPELQAIIKFILSHQDIDTFIDIHCFSQLVLLPWGYTMDRVPNYDQLIALGNAAVEAAGKIQRIKYEAVQVSTRLGIAYGNSIDWAYGVAKKPFTFALEMRPNTTLANSRPYQYPFRVFPNELINVNKEAWAIVQVLASKLGVDGSF